MIAWLEEGDIVIIMKVSWSICYILFNLIHFKILCSMHTGETGPSVALKEGRKVEGRSRVVGEETIEVASRLCGSAPRPGSPFVGSITGKSTPSLVSVKTPARAKIIENLSSQMYFINWLLLLWLVYRWLVLVWLLTNMYDSKLLTVTQVWLRLEWKAGLVNTSPFLNTRDHFPPSITARRGLQSTSLARFPKLPIWLRNLLFGILFVRHPSFKAEEPLMTGRRLI